MGKFKLPVIGIAALCSLVVVIMLNKPATMAYENLEIGDSYSELITLAGDPAYETDGTRWVEPEYKKAKNQLVAKCVKEAWYENWLFPSKYAFCFNNKDVLINKYHWVSW